MKQKFLHVQIWKEIKKKQGWIFPQQIDGISRDLVPYPGGPLQGRSSWPPRVAAQVLAHRRGWRRWSSATKGAGGAGARPPKGQAALELGHRMGWRPRTSAGEPQAAELEGWELKWRRVWPAPPPCLTRVGAAVYWFWGWSRYGRERIWGWFMQKVTKQSVRCGRVDLDLKISIVRWFPCFHCKSVFTRYFLWSFIQ
jgi:hypothetical protein